MAKSTAVARAKIQLPANVAQQLAAEAASITSRIGSTSGDSIRPTLSKRFKMPSGEECAGPLQAVIVDFISYNAYYEGTFDPSDITPPLCAAKHTDPTMLAPYADSPDKQCDTCAACPMNQYGTAKNGRGKACHNARLMVVLPPDATVDTPLMVVKASATAIKSFDGYVSSIVRTFQAPPLAVITDITISEDSEYPSLRFGNPKPCPQDLLALALSHRDTARARLMTKPDFAAFETAKATAVKKPAARRGR